MSDNKDFGLAIGFWRKETGNMLSHGKGLTPEQVKALQELKVGDRLILWSNNPKKGEDAKPTHTLKVFKAKPSADQDF